MARAESNLKFHYLSISSLYPVALELQYEFSQGDPLSLQLLQKDDKIIGG